MGMSHLKNGKRCHGEQQYVIFGIVELKKYFICLYLLGYYGGLVSPGKSKSYLGLRVKWLIFWSDF
jgi:hypothetical protein